MVTFSEYSHTLSQTTRAIKYNPATWMPNDEICAACGKTTSLWLYKKRALVMISATTKCTQPSIYNLKAEMKFIGYLIYIIIITQYVAFCLGTFTIQQSSLSYNLPS